MKKGGSGAGKSERERERKKENTITKLFLHCLFAQEMDDLSSVQPVLPKGASADNSQDDSESEQS